MKRTLMVVACSLFWSVPAYAQTCLGAPTFEEMPMRAGVGVGFSSNTQTILGGVSRGNANWFGGGGLVIETVSDLDGAAKGIFGSGGIERPIGAEKKFFACPLAAIFKTWGLSPAVDTSVSNLLVNIGGSVGYEAATRGQTRILPFGGFAFNHLNSAWSGGFFGDNSFSESFASVQAGVGLILNERMALTPAISVPFREHATTVKFSAAFTIRIGQS